MSILNEKRKALGYHLREDSDSGGQARAGMGFAGTGSGLSGTGAGAAAAGVGGGQGGGGGSNAVNIVGGVYVNAYGEPLSPRELQALFEELLQILRK